MSIDDLIEITKLSELLGYNDMRSVRSWANKNNVPLITIGKKSYYARNFIDLIIENQINSFVNTNFDNPSAVLSAMRSNDKAELSKVAKEQPVDEKVKTQFKKNKSEMSSAAKNLLDKLKSA